MKKIWISGKYFNSRTAAATWLGAQLNRRVRPEEIRRALVDGGTIGDYAVMDRKPEAVVERPAVKTPQPPCNEKRPALLWYPPGRGPLYIRNKWK